MAEYPALEISFPSGPDTTLFDRLYARLDDFSPVAIHEDDVESRCPSAAPAQLVCASSARNAASGAFQTILTLLPSGDGSVKSPG